MKIRFAILAMAKFHPWNQFIHFTSLVDTYAVKFYAALGRMIFLYPYRVICTCLFLALLAAAGCFTFHAESNSEALYFPQNSRAFKDRDLLESYFGVNITESVDVIIEPKQPGNILNPAGFQALFKAWQHLTAITVTSDLDGSLLDYEALCDKPRLFQGFSATNVSLTATGSCAEASLLWCWNHNASIIDSLSQTEVNSCLMSSAASQVLDINHNVQNPFLLLGAFEFDAGTFTSAKAIRMFINLKGFDRDPLENGRSQEELQERDVLQKAVRKYLLAIVDVVEVLNAESSDFRFHLMHTDSLDDALDANTQGDIGLFSFTFVIMISFAIATSGSFHKVYSQQLLAYGGISIVLLSVGAGYGIGAAVFGLPWISFNGVLPFLIIGISVDDMFIILDTFQQQKRLAKEKVKGEGHYLNHVNHQQLIVDTMTECGLSITLTSLTDFLAFSFGTLSAFPSLSIFTGFLAITILVDFCLQITLFVAMLVLDLRRQVARKQDLFVFHKVKGNDDEKQVYFLKPRSSKLSMHRLFGDVYAPWLLKRPMQATVMVLFVGFLITSGVLAPGVERGLQLRDLAPDGHYVIDHLDAVDDAFNQFGLPFEVFTRPMDPARDFTALATQKDYLDLIAAVRANPSVEPLNLNNPSDLSWLEAFHSFYVSTVLGETLSSSQISQNQTLWPQGPAFYPNLRLFLNQTQFAHYFDDLVFDNHVIIHSKFHAQFLFSDNTEVMRKAMSSLRSDMDAIAVSVGPATAFAAPYIAFESFVILWPETFQTLAFAAISVTIVSLVFLVHPVPALLCLWIVVAIDIELFGLMFFWDVSFDTISLTNLVMAVGLSVDFSAHIAHAFMTTQDEEEMKAMAKFKSNSKVESSAKTLFGHCKARCACIQHFYSKERRQARKRRGCHSTS